jgi:hypothetical protein
MVLLNYHFLSYVRFFPLVFRYSSKKGLILTASISTFWPIYEDGKDISILE